MKRNVTTVYTLWIFFKKNVSLRVHNFDKSCRLRNSFTVDSAIMSNKTLSRFSAHVCIFDAWTCDFSVPQMGMSRTNFGLKSGSPEIVSNRRLEIWNVMINCFLSNTYLSIRAGIQNDKQIQSESNEQKCIDWLFFDSQCSTPANPV